jgi:hypothetical protein
VEDLEGYPSVETAELNVDGKDDRLPVTVRVSTF